jgi:probable rRNA maturation factor
MTTITAEREWLEIDITVEAGAWPDLKALEELSKRAVAAAASLAGRPVAGCEVSIVLTDDEAMRALNAQWRNRDEPTNVLSFRQTGGLLLGDIVLGFETVMREADLAGRPLEHHIAHLIVHGFLHLVGYDHEKDEDAEHMMGLERKALARISVPYPYE